MKTTVAFCALSYAISVVGATRPESNSQRLARGLPPLAPKRRFSSGAKRTAPSSTPFSCSPQQNFCCTTLESASSPVAESLLSSLGISQNSCGEQIATGCVPASGNSCSSGTLAKCCGNIVGSGLVGIDCTKVTPSTSSSFVGCGFEQLCVFARKQLLVGSFVLDLHFFIRCPFQRLIFCGALVICIGVPPQQLCVVVFARKQFRRIFFGLGLCFACQQLCVGIVVCAALFVVRQLVIGRPVELICTCKQLCVVFQLRVIQFLFGPAFEQLCVCIARKQLFVDPSVEQLRLAR
ncbi:hypothetical protein C8R45DRAFT_1108717 [Mycena sanguinolenta]|nr:hypothetical protein C8R45DRAFT_1108717 [Mycena sanguinolenta]